MGVLEALRIPELAIELAGTAADLHRVDFLVRELRADQSQFGCDIGLDAPESGRACILHLHNQTLSLE